MGTISKAKAEALFRDLASTGVTISNSVAEIIAKKAWRALGYNLLVDAWADRLADVEFSATVNLTAVTEMVREGSSPVDIALAVRGVSPETVKLWATEIGSDDVSSIAKKKAQRHSSPASTVFVHLGADRLQQLETYASELRGQSATEFVFQVVLDAFNSLGEEYNSQAQAS